MEFLHHHKVQAEAGDGARGSHETDAVLEDEDAHEKNWQAMEDDFVLGNKDTKQRYPRDDRARLNPRIAMRDEREGESDEDVPLELDRQRPVGDVHPWLTH